MFCQNFASKFFDCSYLSNCIAISTILHGPSMFAVKAKIYDLLYNPVCSIDFDETSSYWSAPKSF